ncbi:MAG: 5,6-dimethylbenzimidazole synthase [Hyphomicrobiaceae bacterium]|nr:5,6-dimethylbenzimidazole synthase [Hyphomicrobiaceae bacterium]
MNRAADARAPDAPPAFDEAFRKRLADLLAWRRDVRRFRTDPVPIDLIDGLIATAGLSPSVGNSQPWRWVRVGDPDRRRRIAESFARANADAATAYADDQRAHYLGLKLAGLSTAPVQLAVFCDMSTAQGSGLGRRTMPEMLAYSAVLSVHTLWLAARAHGLGVGWVSIIEPEAVNAALDVPAAWRLIAYLCVGWPEEEHADPELERAGWQARTPITLIER